MRTVVVDLDGTYYSGNTLHDYLGVALRYHLRLGRFLRVAAIACASLLRVVRIFSHHAFKCRALHAAGREEELLERFGRYSGTRIQMPLKRILDSFSGCRIVMATAAPDFYVRRIWHGELLASSFEPDGRLTELRGERKAIAVLARCGEVHTVYTDHHDDIPIALLAQEVVLVNPSRESIEKFEKAGITFTVMRT